MPEEKFLLSDHYGSFFLTGETYSVRFERIFDHPVIKVWDAITQPEQLTAWLGPTEIDGKKGGEIKVKVMQGVMGGKITEWKEGSLLEYTWWKGSVVRYELLTEGKGRCRLIFTHSRLSASQILGAATGWHYHMDALSITLDGRKMPHWPIESWERISGLASAHYKIVLHETGEKDPASDPPLIVERTYDAPVSEVWKAITDKEEMRQWYFDLDGFRPEVGFEFSFSAKHLDKIFVHYCRITEVIPGKKLSYTWRHLNIPGITLLTWELSPEGSKTKLKITHTGLENLATAGPDFSRESHRSGWTYFLDKALLKFLESQHTAALPRT